MPRIAYIVLILLIGIFIGVVWAQQYNYNAVYDKALQAQNTKAYCPGEVMYPDVIGE